MLDPGCMGIRVLLDFGFGLYRSWILVVWTLDFDFLDSGF